MGIKKVVVAGVGVLGSQIAYQTALHDYQVVAYNLQVESAKKRVESLRKDYVQDLGLSEQEFQKGLDNITYSTDLSLAVKDADLVIEALPESLEIKEKFYRDLSDLAPEKTIFASNSSTMTASQLIQFVDRPAKFINLHFANRIWICNVAEIMGSAKTSPEVYQTVVDFARSIGMVPIELHKEKAGYVLNSLLIPFLISSMDLWTQGIADPQTIDKDWMISTGTPLGPFAMLDDIGLRTAYNIVSELAKVQNNPSFTAIANRLKEMIDKGKTGRESGEGFYTYPHPAFADSQFLQA